MELVKTFNSTLNDFVYNLKKCYPDNTKGLLIITELEDTIPLQKFMKSIGENMNKISQKDTTMFNSPCMILNCDLSEIWNSELNNEKNSEVIWKYLQTLVLIGTTIKSKSSNLE